MPRNITITVGGSPWQDGYFSETVSAADAIEAASFLRKQNGDSPPVVRTLISAIEASVRMASKDR